MRFICKHIFGIILAFVISLGLSSCVEEIVSVVEVYPTEYVSFSPYMLPHTKSDDAYSYTRDNLGIEIQDWVSEEAASQTKASPVNTLKGQAGVTAFLYSGTWDETEFINNSAFTFDGNTLSGANIKWADVDEDMVKMRVFAYAPYMKDLTFGSGVPSFTYTVPSDVKQQQDIISAYKEVNVSDSKGKSIALGFGHIMTGIQLKSAFACTVKSVSISGVYGSGIYSLDGKWDLSASESNKEFTITFEEAKSVKAGGTIIDGEQTWMMLPQDLPDGAKLTLLCSDNKSYEYRLSGLKWQQGKMVTYTLYEKTAESSYIYFDLAAGNVSIGKNKVTGYVYEKGKLDPVKKTYTHSDNNTYYIYQSTEAKREAKNPSGVVDENNSVILPEYPAIVTSSGQSWADFITNNDSVEEVIETWDDGKNVRKDGSSAKNEKLIGTAVVRDAGRTHTEYHIKVTGSNANFNLVVDNIYTTYQELNTDKLRGRSKGGISYNSTGNTTLTVNLVGDNRLGYFDIKNTSTDWVYIEGTGSLTAANTDFLTPEDLYSKNTVQNEVALAWDDSYYGTSKAEQGYISNHRKSAIGNDTKSSGHIYNLIINSGTIFAGTTKTENCSAIGGGGNGYGQVTINGGRVTAVATTTGSAIGGGIGFTDVGGEGNVTISGGSVYAYNFATRWDVPSSAIGGGGSKSSIGKLGTVNITNGYVYAYSQLGTAIGGGSSKTKVGGDAVINISGGDITAISDGGAGIGGGSACTGGSKTEIHNGGNAVVTISGNPVIRTGSIGGGITNGAAGSKIGSAKINISGGDIQAQFVMAAGAKETPAFTMSGGVIRDSDVKDPEYKHIQQNGGAVYMEDGVFTMTDGTIRDCSAEYGGAVYIKKGTASATPPSFKMSGGTISNCIATGDGGAVYLEDGSVEISNTAAVRACSASGSGGAVCVKKVGTSVPSFKMSAGTISKNFAGSQGGAIHLEGGSVEVSGGSISGNVVSEGNGGGISVNSGSFLMPLNGTAVINANSTLSKISTGGNGGGVYVTSESDDVKVDILSGSITGNSSAQKGGGIAVDLPSSEVKAEVTVGSLEDSETDPQITDNVTLLQGGGLYVNGENATVTINSGRIADNSTVGYVDNPDVMNEGGMVRLNGGEVNSVYVIFHANADGAYLNGDTNQSEARQRIVTDTKNRIEYPTTFRNGYNFKEWNTRADGLGTPFNAEIVKRSSDLVLYAIWTVN